jgi:hypothetical protein
MTTHLRADVRNGGALRSLPLRLHGTVLNYLSKHRDNFTVLNFILIIIINFDL